MMIRAKLVLGAVMALATTMSALGQACSQTTAKQWQCWEKSLTVGCTDLNYYKDLKIKVTFTKGNTTPLTTYAFWDGGNTMKFRMKFPESGTWAWSTECGGTCGSCIASGILTVDSAPVPTVWPPPAATITSCANPLPPAWVPDLYSRGYPKVESSGANTGRYLTYPDVAGQTHKGFFWLGDTSWNSLVLASASEWNDTYLPDRLNKKFSVLQIALPTDTMGTTPGGQPADRLNQKPFDNCTTTNPLPASCSKWNPAFWQEVDKKIKAANDCGFVVVIVGLMDGVIEKNGNGKYCPPLLADSEVYARNLAARMAGYHVILSPGFDRYSGTNECASRELILDRIESIGNVINDTVPHLLETNHWAGPTTSPEMTGRGPWLDFQLFQSGQAGQESNTDAQLQTLLNRARVIPGQLWQATSPTRPNYNGEAIYDGECNDNGNSNHSDDLLSINYNPYRAREAGYFSLFSGAFGYTFGVAGVYDWGKRKNAPCFDKTGGVIGLDLTGGMLRTSNTQIQYLGNLFRDNLNWTLLTPAPTRVLNNPGAVSEDKRMLAAYGVGGAYLLAYLPDRTNQAIDLDFSAPLSRLPKSGRWFNPRTGGFSKKYGQGKRVTGSSSTYRFCPPCSLDGVNPPCDVPGASLRPACPSSSDGGDWVLVLSPQKSDLYTVTPCRVLDTRTEGGPLVTGQPRLIAVAGKCNIPMDAEAASFNVTVVNPSSGGDITLYPGDAVLPPTTITASFGLGAVRSNNAVIGLAEDGSGSLAGYSAQQSGGQIDIVLDVNGYLKWQTPTVVMHWMVPRELLPWGTGSGLVMAGSATEAAPGTTVLVTWRDLTADGPWTTEPYQPTPDTNGIWYHEILNANYSHRYAAYATYVDTTSTTCIYPGGGSGYSCP